MEVRHLKSFVICMHRLCLSLPDINPEQGHGSLHPPADTHAHAHSHKVSQNKRQIKFDAARLKFFFLVFDKLLSHLALPNDIILGMCATTGSKRHRENYKDREECDDFGCFLSN